MSSHSSVKRPNDVKIVKKVILTCKNLETLPEWISECVSLQKLYCYYNKLTKLPSSLPDSLQKLYCDNNQLTELPSSLPVSLQKLYCDNNKLTELPSSLPASLQTLSCDNNKLVELPSSLPASLQELNCWNNLLTQLPSSLPASLQELHCSDNKLTELPSSLPASLQEFYCSGNLLKQLPESLPASLQKLYCGKNKLTELPSFLPASLQEFHCDDNLIKILPLSLIQNRNLIFFSYQGNAVEDIHPLVSRFLNRQMNAKASVYSDKESVHNHNIQESVRTSIFNVLSDTPTKTIDTVLAEILEDKILSQEAKEALIEYSKDETEHSSLTATFSDLLIPVWQRSFDEDEIKKVLNTEMLDSACKCFTGRMSRLVNCLNGFYPDVVIKIGDGEQIGNIIVLIKTKLEEEGKYSTDLHVELVRSELFERGYLTKTIDEWVGYI